MNISRLTLLLISAATLAACDQKELVMPDTPAPTRGDKVPLQLTSGISMPTTRAFDTTWEADDKIGVYTTVAGTKTMTKSGARYDGNIAYKITNGGNTNGTNYMAFDPTDADEGQIYLPADGSNVDVYAYYPWTAATDPTSIPIHIEKDQSTGQQSFDLMKASALSSESVINIDHTTAKLLFHHALSKVLVKVKPGTGYSAADLTDRIKVELTGQPTDATFDPINQVLNITNGSSPIVMQQLTADDDDNDTSNGIVHTFRAIILPNTDNNGTNPVTTGSARQIKFTVGDGDVTTTYLYDITQEFKAEEQFTFTLTVQATGINVEAAIAEWNTTTITPADPIYEETGEQQTEAPDDNGSETPDPNEG